MSKLSFLILLFIMVLGTRVQCQTKVDSLQQVVKITSNKNEKLKALDKLSRQMIRENHKELIPTLKDYMILAKELKEYDLMASKSRFLIQQHLIRGENKEGMGLIDSMLNFKPHFKKENSEAHLLLKRGGIYFSELNYKKAIKDYQKSADLFLVSKDSIFAADGYFFAGQAYSNTGNFIKAIDKFEKAAVLYEILKDYQYMFLVNKELDLVYRRNGLSELANEKLLKLIDKSKAYKSFKSLTFFYLSLVSKAIDDKKLVLAEEYLDSSKHYEKFITDISMKSYNKITLKNLELRLKTTQNDLKAADKVYDSTLLVEEKNKHVKIIESFKLYKANYLLKKGKVKEALNLLKSAKEFAKKNTQRNNNLLDVEKLLGTVYEKLGKETEALVHKNNYIALKDSINKLSLTNALAFHQTRFETAQKEKEILKQENEIQQLEAEKKIAAGKRNSLIAILFSLVLIALGIWWSGKQKRKQLQVKIKKNKEELTEFTNQLLQKRKEQDELQSQLTELKEKVTEKEAVTSVQDLIATKILTKEDWYIFKKKFVSVYPNFFIDIKNKGYKLTKAEERLVSLEKLGLDNSEIANMLGVSLDTIFMSRYRLRKKIAAPKEVSITEYLS
ncbi:tetratricopeptide repeat protein [uncultured Tenacibaculum sp.]|uniref:tetratricopeptide repeat protein n=1 Tax=uncultured Tenacibaculum sp. TaxID=174713 RepID=UPI002636A081|nr:tetratricopeptide repeat protein [uncultured Tenacibaculum sp.]